jgi:glycosyltransferase involved in cell wall biosynthesis
MKEFPLVSVVAVCYNHAQYVVETLESIKNQTYPNIQLIIMDDCSTDDSVTVIKQWIDKTDYSCQLVLHEKNQGLCKTLNEALELVSGDYYQCIACDDVLIEEKLERQVHLLKNSNSNTKLCCSNYSHIDENGRVIKKQFFKPDFKFPKNTFKAILNGYLDYGIIIHSPTVLLKTCVFKELGGYVEKYIQEDLYMWLNITLKFEAIFISDILVKYRVLSSSLSKSSIYKNKMYKDRILVGSYFLAKDLNDEEKRELIKHNRKYIKYFLRKDYSLNNEYLKFLLTKFNENNFKKLNTRNDVDELVNEIVTTRKPFEYIIFRIKILAKNPRLIKNKITKIYR